MEDDRWIKEPDKKDKKNYSKFIVVVVLIGVALAALIAFLQREPKVEILTLDKTNVSLGIDETDRLTASVKPEDAKPVLIWDSSDENIVTVIDGVVMARSAGKAVVKVSVKNQQDLCATCEYTVQNPDVDMQTLDILEEPIVLRPGGHQQLTVNFTPEDQTEMILWASTNESVARVSPRGKVEAIKVGYAKIIAISDRTGVADTAIVSVEGAGVNNIVAPSAEAPKPAQAATPKPVPVKATNPAATTKPVQTKAYKPVQTATSKPASVKATNLAATTKPVQTNASKPIQTKESKPVQTATSKPAPVKATNPAATTKPVQTKASKPVQTKVTSKEAVPAKASKPAPAKTTKPTTTTVTKSTGSKNFGYATYKGKWPDDVNGRMEFKTSHVIDSRDPKGRVAQPGDYVVGEWSEGHLVQGVWYGADNKAKGSILIGK